jgi:hypothetical protein
MQLAVTPDEGGLDGYSADELALMWRLGQRHLERLDAWDQAYRACEEEYDRPTCIAAIKLEEAYHYP